MQGGLRVEWLYLFGHVCAGAEGVGLWGWWEGCGG